MKGRKQVTQCKANFEKKKKKLGKLSTLISQNKIWKIVKYQQNNWGQISNRFDRFRWINDRMSCHASARLALTFHLMNREIFTFMV